MEKNGSLGGFMLVLGECGRVLLSCLLSLFLTTHQVQNGRSVLCLEGKV